MSEKLKVILAAGGTGGHIFPAESLAAELLKKDHVVMLLSDKRYRKYSHSPAQMEVKKIPSASLSGGIITKIKAVFSILLGFIAARKILKEEKADVVVGFGGYPSFPTVLAAISLGVKTVIHEQNSVLGRVNKLLAPRVGAIATSFEKVSGVAKDDKSKVVFTGNPVRPEISALKDLPYPALKKGDALHILVIGGSQGASVFSEVVPHAILSLPKEILEHVRIDQQCRQEDLLAVREIYEKAGVNAELATFFDDMPARLASAHLVVARSGASTISELTLAGKPSILVPYKHAMDDHQTANAVSLEKAGASIVVAQDDFNPDFLKNAIEEFVENPDKLSDMAVRARESGKENAVKDLAKLVVG